MKNLNKVVVELVFDLLIHTNGTTTTLDVKNHLRDLGYFAEQSEVSKLVNEITSANLEMLSLLDPDAENIDELYKSELDGNHNVYSFCQYLESVYSYATSEDDTSDINYKKNITFNDTNGTVSISDTDDTAILDAVNLSSTSDKDLEAIFYVEDHLINSSVVGDDNWVVFDKSKQNEFHVYSPSLSRDNVRCEYRKATGIKFSDIRAKRKKNFA